MSEWYEIIDDFLDPGYHQLLINSFLGSIETVPLVQWNYEINMSGPRYGDPTISHQGFSHSVWWDGVQDSSFYPILLPMIENIRNLTSSKFCYRAISYMTLQTGSKRIFAHHVDMPGIKHKSVIYYLHNSDGSTCLYEEEKPLDSHEYPELESLTLVKKVQPKENRLLIFEGNHWHTGESPVDSSRRVIFNMNFGNTPLEIK